MAAADPLPALIPRAGSGSAAADHRLARLWRAMRRSRRGDGLRTPQGSAIAPDALEFQDELDRLMAEPLPASVRRTPWWVALLLATLLLFAALARIEIVVTGSGRLAPDAPLLVVQPMERAVIREIAVRPGDAVMRGQVLATLDPTFAEADRAALTARHRALRAQLRRLEAEASGQHAVRPDPADPDALLQAVLQAQRQAVFAARLRAFDEDLQALRANLRTLEESQAVQREQVALAQDVEALRARLLASQIGSRLHYLGARSQRLQAEQEHQLTRNRAEEQRHALLSKQAERQTFLEDWQRQLLEETVRVRAEAVQVEETLAKAQRLAELLVLTAPEDGIVLEVARRSAGSIAREAEPLVTLVPAQAPLIAEVVIDSADIGYARPGDPVALKIAAFPYQRHGMAQGRLRAISQESYPRQAAEEHGIGSTRGGEAVHRAQVELTGAALRQLPTGSRLIPGMTVSAEIKVGTRTVLAYFLDPLLRGLHEGIREP
jgi:HlyD family secretion protein